MILADARWRGPHGIGRFASETIPRLPVVTPLARGLPPLHPLEPFWLSGLLAVKRPRAYFSPGFNPPIWSPVPLVFTIHDLIHMRFSDEGSATKRAYYHYVVGPAARRAHRVLTVSEFSRSEILEWAGLPEAQVTVVGNGVGAGFAPEGARHDPGYPYLLYVGNTAKPHKNFLRLLEAFALANLPKDLRLLCTAFPGKRELRRIEVLGLGEQVVFVGTVPDRSLPKYYRGALALVFPSLYEGFGLPALEAMASGIPVVVSGVTALPEVVGDAALFVDPYDVESIAWGIQQVVEDASLRQKLVQKGIRRARLFSWDRVAERIWQVLRGAAEEG